MVQCACLTAKGDPCKKDATGGSVYCATHQKKCVAKAKVGKAKAKVVPVPKAKAKIAAAEPAPVPAAKAAKAKVGKAKVGKAPKAKAKVKKNVKVGTRDVARVAPIKSPEERTYVTEYRDTDLTMLQKLEPLDLFNMCTMNKSFLKLCKTNVELRRKYEIARIYNVVSKLIERSKKAPKGTKPHTISIGGVDVPDIIRRTTVEVAKTKKGVLAVRLVFGLINLDIAPGLFGPARAHAIQIAAHRRMRLLQYIQTQVLRPLFLFADQPIVVNYIVSSRYSKAYLMPERDYMEHYMG
jgi:hypothetical protein